MRARAQRGRCFFHIAYWVFAGVLVFAIGVLGWRVDQFSGLLTLDEAYGDSAAKIAYLREVKTALEERGIDLVVLAYPYRQHLYGSGGDPVGKRNAVPDQEALATTLDLGLLEKVGIRTLDLWGAYEEEGRDRELWREDGIHLTPEAARRIARRVNLQLRKRKLLRPNQRETGKFQVIMGDCFAIRMGSLMESQSGGASGVKGLPCNGDRGRVANLLFLFPEEYLDGCERVYWAMSYNNLHNPKFAPLETEPDFQAAEEAKFKVLCTGDIGVSKEELEERFKTMPYENALFEMPARVVGAGGDLKPETEVILTTYAAKRRTPEWITGVRAGDVINVRAMPLNAYLRTRPAVASESYFKTCDSFEIPRYWVLTWVRVKIARPEEGEIFMEHPAEPGEAHP